MAYIIGLVSEKEKEILEKRGWDLESVEDTLSEIRDMLDNSAKQEKDPLIPVAVYVDSNVLEVMSGPGWEGCDD